MNVAADLAVYDRSGQPILAVAVKAKSESTPDWAAMFRRNLLAHGFSSHTPYFLIAALDRIYFWRESKLPDSLEPKPPDVWFEAADVFRPYLPQTGSSLRVGESSLELAVSGWLTELFQGRGTERISAKASDWLRREGLLDALREGTLVHR
jgi:hypothetical protein